MKRHAFLALGAAAMGVACALSVVSAGPAAPQPAPPKQGSLEATALERHAQVVADAWGVEPDVALQQLALQEKMDHIPYERLDAGFVEVQSTPGQDFAIHYDTSRHVRGLGFLSHPAVA